MSHDQQALIKDSDDEERRLAKKLKNFIYNPHDIIGSGFSSQVFKGVNQTNLQTIAIKVIQLNKIQNEVQKYLLNNQITALRTLKHKNILQTIDILMTKNNVYIVTEFCQDGDLRKLIDKKKKIRQNDPQKNIKHLLTEWQVLNIARDIVQGYRAIQQKNILHRDLKSANIFLSKGIAKIADFGFCQIISQSAKKPQVKYNVGSPAYMSPQSYKENIYSHKSDVWSIGIIIYQMIYGQTPDKTLKYDQMVANLISGKIKGIENQQIKNILQKIFKKELSERVNTTQLLELINSEIRRVHNFRFHPIVKNNMQQLHKNSSPNKFSLIIPNHTPGFGKQQNQNKVKILKSSNSKIQQKNVQYFPHPIPSPRNIKTSPLINNQSSQDKEIQRKMRSSIELLLFLYRLLKLVSETSINQALVTRLIIFRHRSFIDQHFPIPVHQDQSFQQYQYLKSKFDDTYIQKQLNFSLNNPSIALLNQHTNSIFQNPTTINVYLTILKQACDSCSNYIFGVGTVEQSVIDFNKVGTMWDYLLLQYQILLMTGEGKSLNEIVQKLQINKLIKQQPKKLTHKHYELLKIKSQLSHHSINNIIVTQNQQRKKLNNSKDNIIQFF